VFEAITTTAIIGIDRAVAPREWSHVTEDLPLVDEHHVLVSAPPSAVWGALTAAIRGFASSEAFASLLGATPNRASGGALTEGATLPGFRVAEAVPDDRLRLTGHHHFSRYQLLLTVAEHPTGTVLTACTRAEFPGPHGAIYRLLVIGSRIHRTLVIRLLHDVRRRAEVATPQ